MKLIYSKMILNTISMPYKAGPTKKRKEGIHFFSSSMVMVVAMATCESKKKKKTLKKKNLGEC